MLGSESRDRHVVVVVEAHCVAGFAAVRRLADHSNGAFKGSVSPVEALALRQLGLDLLHLLVCHGGFLRARYSVGFLALR